MRYKIASTVPRSSDISPEEKNAARAAIDSFQRLLKKLWAARQHDQRLINVLEKNPGTDTTELFDQRHLLRRFQQEVKDRYTDIIFSFAGKKQGDSVMEGAIHTLKPLEKDSKTRQIKESLQDAMQQMVQYIEEFIEAFEDFNSKDQIQKIITSSIKADQILQSIENIVEKQMQPHFEQNILQTRHAASIRDRIKKRARLINLLGV